MIMKKSVLLLASALILSASINAQDNGVSISSGSSVADPTAMLDVQSTTKGILIPRLTTVERDAIVNPATSLIIYNSTDLSFQYFDGSNWKVIGDQESSIENMASSDLTFTENRSHNLNGNKLIIDAETNSGPNTGFRVNTSGEVLGFKSFFQIEDKGGISWRSALSGGVGALSIFDDRSADKTLFIDKRGGGYWKTYQGNIILQSNKGMESIFESSMLSLKTGTGVEVHRLRVQGGTGGSYILGNGIGNNWFTVGGTEKINDSQISFNGSTAIKGKGSTSATNAFLVQNSNGTELFKITDDGTITGQGLGGTSENMVSNDLTFTENRTHNLNGNDLSFNVGANQFILDATTSGLNNTAFKVLPGGEINGFESFFKVSHKGGVSMRSTAPGVQGGGFSMYDDRSANKTLYVGPRGDGHWNTYSGSITMQSSYGMKSVFENNSLNLTRSTGESIHRIWVQGGSGGTYFFGEGLGNNWFVVGGKEKIQNAKISLNGGTVIKGTGTTSSTKALTVIAGNGNEAFKVYDDDGISVGYGAYNNSNAALSDKSTHVQIGGTSEISGNNINDVTLVGYDIQMSGDGKKNIAAIGSHIDATNTGVALGSYLNLNTKNAFIIGQGLNASTPLTNSVENSLAIGWESATPSFLFSKTGTSYLNGERVSIGTTSSMAKLTVSGDAALIQNTTVGQNTNFLKLFDNIQGTTFASIGSNGSDMYINAGGPAGNSIQLRHNQQTQLEVKSGKVNIKEVLNLSSTSAPANPVAGDMYFDGADLKLYTGGTWKKVALTN